MTSEEGLVPGVLSFSSSSSSSSSGSTTSSVNLNLIEKLSQVFVSEFAHHANFDKNLCQRQTQEWGDANEYSHSFPDLDREFDQKKQAVREWISQQVAKFNVNLTLHNRVGQIQSLESAFGCLDQYWNSRSTHWSAIDHSLSCHYDQTVYEETRSAFHSLSSDILLQIWPFVIPGSHLQGVLAQTPYQNVCRLPSITKQINPGFQSACSRHFHMLEMCQASLPVVQHSYYLLTTLVIRLAKFQMWDQMFEHQLHQEHKCNVGVNTNAHTNADDEKWDQFVVDTLHRCSIQGLELIRDGLSNQHPWRLKIGNLIQACEKEHDDVQIAQHPKSTLTICSDFEKDDNDDHDNDQSDEKYEIQPLTETSIIIQKLEQLHQQLQDCSQDDHQPQYRPVHQHHRQQQLQQLHQQLPTATPQQQQKIQKKLERLQQHAAVVASVIAAATPLPTNITVIATASASATATASPSQTTAAATSLPTAVTAQTTATVFTTTPPSKVDVTAPPQVDTTTPPPLAVIKTIMPTPSFITDAQSDVSPPSTSETPTPTPTPIPNPTSFTSTSEDQICPLLQ